MNDQFGMNNNATSSYSPYSSNSFGGGLGGYGNSYGSYGGGFGSYGGGLGGYGGGLGGYGSRGYGMYGNSYGRPGMGGPNQQGSFMEFAIQYLDSFSYGIGSLCEMTRNIEMNAEGLSRFWTSMRNILFRLCDWFARSFKGGRELLMRGISKLKEKLFSKPFLSGLLFSGQAPKVKIYNMLFRFCLITLALTVVLPLLKLKG